MKRNVLFLLLLAAAGVAAQAPPGGKPVIDNDRVTVWDLAAAQGMAGGDEAVQASQSMDTLAVYLMPEAVQGKVEFVARGGGLRETLRRSGASRMAVIAFKDKVVKALPNTSGLPDAFPRPRSKKVSENPRFVVWDYTFERGNPSPMHFHPRDTVTVYLKDGMVVSTTPDGTKADNEFTYATVRFNPSNRTHSETLVRGESRIIAVELK